MNICPKSYNFLAKVGKLLFWGTSIGIVVPAYYRETVLQFSAIFVEGLIFSPPYYLYVYYYFKVRAFRPMGCTPRCPVETLVSQLPPLGSFLVHLMYLGMYGVRSRRCAAFSPALCLCFPCMGKSVSCKLLMFPFSSKCHLSCTGRGSAQIVWSATGLGSKLVG